MKILLLLLASLAYGQVEGIPRHFDEVYHSPGAGQKTFPTGIGPGYTVTVIDGDSAAPCTTGGGTTKSQCRYSGSAWQPVGPAGGIGSGDALVANPLSQFAPTSSAQLRGVMSDETGSGAAVFGTAPAIAGMTGTGVFDLNGTSGLILRFGTTAPSSGDCDAAGERGSVYVRTGDPASVATRVSICTQTGASTYAWMPISHGVGATDPATCSEGSLFYNTTSDTLRACTATDTWGAIGGGSAAGSSNDIQVNNSGSLAGGRCTMDSSQNLTCTGTVAAPILSATGTTAGEVSTYELALNGSEYISWLAPDSITTTYRLMFPTAVPSAGQVLTFSALSGGIATGTWSTPSSTISTPFFFPFGPVSGAATAAYTGAANRLHHIAANAPAAMSVSNVNFGAINTGNFAFAFYDSSCNYIGQTASTTCNATSCTVAVASAPITIPAGKFYVSWTGDTTNSAPYGTGSTYVADTWNAGATPEYFYGTAASWTGSVVTFPSSCGTRTAVANGSTPAAPGLVLR